MKIIGINFLSESSVCLLENGDIKYAISQERLNRKKNWYGIPFESINHVLKNTNNKEQDIDYFTTFGLSAILKDVPDKKIYDKKELEINNSNLQPLKKKNQIKFLRKRYDHEKEVIWVRTKRLLNKLKKKYQKKLKIYDHHTAHAASALYFSGWKNCYVLTIDGWGDNSSSKFFKAVNGKLNEICSTSTIDSLGYFYGSITKLLGFKPHQHEGKILGLASYGNAKKTYRDISKMISFNRKNNSFVGNFDKGIYLPRFDNHNLNFLKKKYTREDICAATQKRLEDVVIQFIKNIKDNNFYIALAGGIFANVKLNQKILELKKVKDVFIFPNMGDGGLSIGTALLCHYEKKKYEKKKLNNLYLGPEYSSDEILKEIKKNKLNYKQFKYVEREIAIELNRGKVVACFQNRMEFGPRALGNRSILCRATDIKINDWLNKKLKRTEFMPFAPVVLEKFAKELFVGFKKSHRNSRFMTITYKCKPKMVRQSPAAVHVDNTARPQIINSKVNLKMYKILSEYYLVSKIPTLINTSFNMHEEPIVCSPKDSIRAFKDSKIDYLYIGNYLVKKS